MPKKKTAKEVETVDTEEVVEASAEAPADVAPPVEKDTQNGVTRPKGGTKTGRVWEIADDLSNKLNSPVPRKDVLAQATAEGINASTAATQYGRWRKYYGLGKETVAEPDDTEVEDDNSVE